MVWAHNKIDMTCKDEPTEFRTKYKDGEGKADRKRDGMTRTDRIRVG